MNSKQKRNKDIKENNEDTRANKDKCQYWKIPKSLGLIKTSANIGKYPRIPVLKNKYHKRGCENKDPENVKQKNNDM